MYMNDGDLLSGRLVSLERQNRKLWTALTGVLAISAFAFLLGAKSSETAERLEAKAFILKDNNGKTRAALQMGKWGNTSVTWEGPQLVLLDLDGKKRVEVNYAKQTHGGSSENVNFQFFDKDGETQLGADTVSENGQVNFYLRHKDGARVSLMVHPNHSEVELIHNKTYPAAGAKMFATKDARGFHVNDIKIGPVIEAKRELDMCVENGNAKITVYDKEGNPIFSKP